MMDRLVWLNYRGGKKTQWAWFHRQTPCFLLDLIHSRLVQFTSDAAGRVNVNLLGLLESVKWSVISDRVTDCGRWGRSEFAPAEPWLLADHGDRSPLRCQSRVCVSVCVSVCTFYPVTMTTTARKSDLVVWVLFFFFLRVGGWVLWPCLNISAYLSFVCVGASDLPTLCEPCELNMSCSSTVCVCVYFSRLFKC